MNADELWEQIVKDRIDAARYRRLRENWIDCAELNLHGRLSVIDNAVDCLLLMALGKAEALVGAE